MTDRESKEGKERFGPIIERNERRTKRHSKRVLVFFVLLLSAVILLVTSRAVSYTHLTLPTNSRV